MTPTPDTLLKTQQVARALGVGVSTIKRWVDSGEIPARKTVGGHRLISQSDMLTFARDRGLPVGALDHPEVKADRGPLAVDLLHDSLATALKRGRSREVKSLIRRARSEGIDAATLADVVLRPAMEIVGHDWELGGLDIYQEHRASRLVESVLMELIQQVDDEPGPSAPLALGAAPEGDLYTVSGLFCELALRELGWEAINLGANLPLSSLARAVQVHQPRLIWLTIHHVDDRERFVAEYNAFHALTTATSAAVILGGPGLTPDLRPRLVAASLGDRIAHLVEFARRLAPTGRSPRPAPSHER